MVENEITNYYLLNTIYQLLINPGLRMAIVQDDERV